MNNGKILWRVQFEIDEKEIANGKPVGDTLQALFVAVRDSNGTFERWREGRTDDKDWRPE